MQWYRNRKLRTNSFSGEADQCPVHGRRTHSPSEADMDPNTILEDVLIKRSQQKKRTSPLNYKERVFVLTKSKLAYYEGKPERKTRKGLIDLQKIKCVEIVRNGSTAIPCQNKYPFQVIYDTSTLYIFAPSNEMRSVWVQNLKEEIKQNPLIMAKFHPQFWHEGVWQCCRQVDKLAPGCEEYNLFGDISRKPLPPVPGNDTAGKTRRPPPPPPPEEEGAVENTEEEVVIALYNFAGMEPHDLTLVIGEEYVILEKCDVHWYKARNKHGEEGYIPSNYVTEKKLDNLDQYVWYCRDINRNKSEQLLRKADKEGGFLIRDSSNSGTYKYTLSLYTKSAGEGSWSIRHYHIKQVESTPMQYYLAEKYHFSSIPKLIEYHQHNAAGLVSRLRYPVGKEGRSAPTTAGFSYEKWEINPSELTFMKELGSGQYGVVRLGKWRAQHKVAIKTIRPGAMLEEDFIEEARVMMKLSHPNLVQLYGVCTQQKPMYIVTEFMELGCLLNYIRQRRGSFSTEMLLSICQDVSEGMVYLEQNSFIHRDLAARNCLVNEALEVKVSDFGMARYVLDDQYTSSSGVKFPVKWSPPEVFNFCRYSSKSDVWSFGVLMWEVFTEGKMPFEKNQNHEVVMMVMQGHRLYKPQKATTCIYDIMQLCWREVCPFSLSCREACPSLRPFSLSWGEACPSLRPFSLSCREACPSLRPFSLSCGEACPSLRPFSLSCGEACPSLHPFSLSCGEACPSLRPFSLSCREACPSLFPFSLSCGEACPSLRPFSLSCREACPSLRPFSLSCREACPSLRPFSLSCREACPSPRPFSLSCREACPSLRPFSLSCREACPSLRPFSLSCREACPSLRPFSLSCREACPSPRPFSLSCREACPSLRPFSLSCREACPSLRPFSLSCREACPSPRPFSLSCREACPSLRPFSLSCREACPSLRPFSLSCREACPSPRPFSLSCREACPSLRPFSLSCREACPSLRPFSLSCREACPSPRPFSLSCREACPSLRPFSLSCREACPSPRPFSLSCGEACLSPRPFSLSCREACPSLRPFSLSCREACPSLSIQPIMP
ncbi:tyrosine-protein kinase Tec isoform X3 [Brienomyrus brachyistius]|uniref:tyrosine-protein kinase Tec isoform X3 n=1 Tax=Brienomyrus brachyistius TaxID=42636 RepID=UPI0020B2D661|nr:tyrosine-protein kinase Tec isoform X3 [Brienomyrus brachyistius]